MFESSLLSSDIDEGWGDLNNCLKGNKDEVELTKKCFVQLAERYFDEFAEEEVLEDLKSLYALVVTDDLQKRARN